MAGFRTAQKARPIWPIGLISTVFQLAVDDLSRTELPPNLTLATAQAVSGDPLRLQQILTNLVGNAPEFTPHGHVFVTVAEDLRLGRRTTLHISVTDTGIGIPPDKQGSIFEAFTHADVSTTRRFGGTGLGLTISRRWRN